MYSWDFFYRNFIDSYNTLGNLFLGVGLAIGLYSFLIFTTITIQVIAQIAYQQDFKFSFEGMFWKSMVPSIALIMIGLSLKGL